MNKSRLLKTLIASILASVINMITGLLITPFVVNNCGAEAYGFVSLAHNFTNYALILTLAVNSMSSRFITIEYEKNNIEKANKYFNSVLVANIVIILILLVPAIGCVLFFDKFLNISKGLILDTKILFMLVFTGFFANIFGGAFSSATFVSNRKDLEAKREIEAYLIKFTVIVSMFFLLNPHIYYVGIASLAMNLYTLILNIIYKFRLLPEIKIKKKYFDLKSIKTVLASGLWNSVSQLSQCLLEGADLLIANIFLDANQMGVIAIAKLLPGVIEMLLYRAGSIFLPSYTIAYANKNDFEYKSNLRKSIVILTSVSVVILCGVTVLGESFFALWVPEEDAVLLSVLTFLTLISYPIRRGLLCMEHIMIVANKVKYIAFAELAKGIAKIIIVFVLLKFTKLGVYSIVGISSLLAIISYIVFYIPKSASLVNIKKRFFVIPVIKGYLLIIANILILYYIKGFLTINTWISFFASVVIVGTISSIITLIFMPNIEEKKAAINFLRKKLKR